MPTQRVLSAARYCDQFFVSKSCAAPSSPMHSCLSRWRVIAPAAAASQLGPMFKIGGSSAPACAIKSPDIMPVNMILAIQAIMGRQRPLLDPEIDGAHAATGGL